MTNMLLNDNYPLYEEEQQSSYDNGLQINGQLGKDYTWGSCFSAKRQFPANISQQQKSIEPKDRVSAPPNYYVEEILRDKDEIKR